MNRPLVALAGGKDELRGEQSASPRGTGSSSLTGFHPVRLVRVTEAEIRLGFASSVSRDVSRLGLETESVANDRGLSSGERLT
jgi:hypothetical protein